MLYLIGLGLGDVDDVTLKGSEAIKRCQRVFLEAYTSILSCGVAKEQLERVYGKEVIVADRDMVESESETILDEAANRDVAFLVVGDPFGATTHCDLLLRAKQKNIDVKVIHNASIMNAVGCCGLQLYRFGETVSVVLWTETWQPDSYYDKIAENRSRGLHTLCLLDIKMKEQTVENMMKNRKVYEPPRFMTCNEAARQLTTIAKRRKEQGLVSEYDGATVCVGLARIGWDDQKIVACTLEQMCDDKMDMGPPLHSIIVTGDLHPLEHDMLNLWKQV